VAQVPDVLSTALLDAANEQQRHVSGLKDTLALPLGSWGEVVSRVVVELMLDALGTASTHILRTGWLLHSSSACFVLTTQFLKVYDLAQDKDFARARFPDAR
jgi:hypothetical protein